MREEYEEYRKEARRKIGPAKSRKGIGIAECLVLIVVLALATGAIFSTLGWSTGSYTFARREMKGRELLFNWVQTFESLWPTPGHPSPEDAFEKAANALNGTWDRTNRLARVNGFTIVPRAGQESAGKRVIDLKIYGGNNKTGKLIVSMGRSYNIFSSETVSDDSLL
ncbi:MAG: hypothetical protein LBQ90_10620 [Synergistaceae bacterium]|jgi:hypothetical protein|nr:hypothetical protein [Synergistaceae bacterium]